MLSRTEIERLAAAAHELRPDWPVKSLCTWLLGTHANRAYRDVAVALAWVACDPQTNTPKRMDEAGPWWQAVKVAGSDATDHRYARCPEPGHTSFPAANCAACRSEKLAAPDEQTAAPTLAISADQAAINERGAANAKRALAHHTARTTRTKEQPE
ncbi:hypothetical protein MHY85_05245 [Cellulomonas sp. ACRRI]|uniref:hypothetical protein n=1 Tax=Cellulomonas sp. ACRRI TaxID=2918188 RepID=UPI001EF3125C|nr:hypothetical protein [Cellulomonas sp. ACRRI]MCG7285381.1 hypothetical protein [Cellulomonas sp. ACRRI]